MVFSNLTISGYRWTILSTMKFHVLNTSKPMIYPTKAHHLTKLFKSEKPVWICHNFFIASKMVSKEDKLVHLSNLSTTYIPCREKNVPNRLKFLIPTIMKTQNAVPKNDLYQSRPHSTGWAITYMNYRVLQNSNSCQETLHWKLFTDKKLFTKLTWETSFHELAPLTSFKKPQKTFFCITFRFPTLSAVIKTSMKTIFMKSV